MPNPPPRSGAVAAEQSAVTAMYARLDELTERAARDLDRVRRSPTAGTPAARVEREAMLGTLLRRHAALVSAERRLCFGRLDHSSGADPVYIGRLSLADASQRPMLTDWRAPAAEPFYRATSATPMGVARRRHILLEGRTVTAVEDDVLDLDAAQDEHFEGNGALMAALAARRTGRMGDIVATIRAEQDQIIRAPLGGILVVEGGPGCGKTVVGLHRAAYLLYTHRDRVAASGVLVVGPNPMFLRYISQVLPGLGESSAVLATPGQLYPGVEGVPEAVEAVAALKGDLRMAGLVARAVRARQRVPDRPRPLVVAGTRITLTPGMVTAARDRARASRKPYNPARTTFVLSVLDRLAGQLATARRVDLSANRDILLADLRDSPDVRREVNLCWMPLTPQKLLADLFAEPARLAGAGEDLTPAEQALLARPRGAPWTVSDVPLLDEAAELLGEDDEPARLEAAVRAADRAAHAEYARGVLEMTGVTELTADALADRYSGGGRTRRAVIDAALADRSWAYGHVVVDEAQELTPMQWRMLLRRCPSRSMTVVGDPAQAGSPGAAGSWAAVLDDAAPGRWSVERLTVNYRTPTPMMELASRVLAATGEPAPDVQSVRDGHRPELRRVDLPDGDRVAALARACAEALREWIGEEGRSSVLVAPALREPLAAALAELLPAGTLGAAGMDLDHPASVLTVAQAKGLEFDQVIVAEPAELLAASSRGAHDLYVALTRATSRLHVLHTGDLPAGFEEDHQPDGRRANRSSAVGRPLQ